MKRINPGRPDSTYKSSIKTPLAAVESLAICALTNQGFNILFYSQKFLDLYDQCFLAKRFGCHVITLKMNINADFTQKVVIHTDDLPWESSPAAGVERKYLDRMGGEVARASSVVKYAPGASFAEHVHGGGEEILVIEGQFSDQYGHYPAGTYLRNPPNSAHAPYSKEGCTLFVKLRQFHPEDTLVLRTNTASATWYPGLVLGLSVMPLHDFDGVGTALVRWAPDTVFNPHIHPGGEEIFVLKGVFHDEHGSYPAGTWIRNPRYSRHQPFTKSEGALIYVKTGHLDYPIV